MKKRNLNLSIFSKGPSSEPHMPIDPSTFQKQPEKSYFRITHQLNKVLLKLTHLFQHHFLSHTHTHKKISISCLVLVLILLVTFPLFNADCQKPWRPKSEMCWQIRDLHMMSNQKFLHKNFYRSTHSCDWECDKHRVHKLTQ